MKRWKRAFLSSISSPLASNSQFNWALFDQAFISLINFITGILLARHLGVEAFGVYSLVWLVAFLFQDIKMPLIVSPMMSISPKQNENEMAQYFGIVIIHQVVFSFFAFILLFSGALLVQTFYPHWGVTGLALPISIASLAFLSQDFLRRYFFAALRPKLAFINDLVTFGGQFLVILTLIHFQSLSIENILWGISFTAILALAIGVRNVGPIDIPSASFFKSITGRHWSFSKWIVASVSLGWVANSVFVFISSAYLGPAAAGIMRACNILTGATNILFLGFENFVPGQASRIVHEEGVRPLLKYLLKISIFGAGLIALLIAVIIVSPEYWLTTFFGKEYAPFGHILVWYAVIQLFIFFQRMSSITLRAIEHTSPMLLVQAAVFISAMILVIPLVSNFGLYGAMSGLLINSIVELSIFSIIIPKQIRMLLSDNSKIV